MDITSTYSDGEYFQKNKNWHTEDSPYKASFVVGAIARNNVDFTDCADVGCGAGLITEILAERFPDKHFDGYDLSKDVKIFWSDRKCLSNFRLINEDLLRSEKQYDLIVCLDVFEHVEDFYGFLRTLRNKGRTFIFNIPLDMNVMKLVTSGIKYAREEVGHLHYFNYYTAIMALKDCGYKIIDDKLSAAYLSTMPRNIRQWVVLPIRLLSILFGKRFASKCFGGISLVVVASAD